MGLNELISCLYIRVRSLLYQIAWYEIDEKGRTCNPYPLPIYRSILWKAFSVHTISHSQKHNTPLFTSWKVRFIFRIFSCPIAKFAETNLLQLKLATFQVMMRGRWSFYIVCRLPVYMPLWIPVPTKTQ